MLTFSWYSDPVVFPLWAPEKISQKNCAFVKQIHSPEKTPSNHYPIIYSPSIISRLLEQWIKTTNCMSC
jgi:hypothetical protein